MKFVQLSTVVPLVVIIMLAVFLRVYRLDTLPASLNWDEAAIAWNGYSIGKTHLDEWGTKLPLSFRSFGDYKAPGLIYLVAGITRIFGLSVWAIRLPVVAGSIATVIAVYLLAGLLGRRLCLSIYEQKLFTLSTTFFAAVSPWHIFFSRGAFEATIALSLTVISVLLFMGSVQHILLLPLSLLAAVGSMYTYHSPKLFIPCMFLLLIGLHWKEFVDHLRLKVWKISILAISIVIVVLAAVPLVRSSLFDKGSERLQTSIFYDEQNERRSIDGHLVTQFVQNYVAHLDPKFFILGNQLGNFRTELQYSGKISIIELVLALFGTAWLIHKKSKYAFLLIGWVILAIVPAAIGKEVPHGIRAMQMVPSLWILSGFGFITVIHILSKKQALRFVIPAVALSVFILQYVHFIQDYFIKFPVYGASHWQYGMKEVADLAKTNEGNVQKILITSKYGQPHVLTFVYQNRDPLTVLWGGMSKYQFREINWDGDQFCEKCLIIGTGEEIPVTNSSDTYTFVKTINFPDGTPAFKAVLTK